MIRLFGSKLVCLVIHDLIMLISAVKENLVLYWTAATWRALFLLRLKPAEVLILAHSKTHSG